MGMQAGSLRYEKSIGIRFFMMEVGGGSGSLGRADSVKAGDWMLPIGIAVVGCAID